MRRIGIVVVSICLMAASPAIAQESPVAAIHLPTTSAETQEMIAGSGIPSTPLLLLQEPQRRRSAARTWAGVGLIAVGGFVAANAAASSCATTAFGSAVFDTQTCGQAWTKLGFGAGGAVVGILLATVWSDVPVEPSTVSLIPLPGGMRIGVTLNLGS